jgi:hypothetical protein
MNSESDFDDDDDDDDDGSSASDSDGKLYGIIKLQNTDKKPEISGIFFLVSVYTCAVRGRKHNSF